MVQGDVAGGRGAGAKLAGCHFCPAGNLWNRFIMFAYNCGPSRDAPRKRRRAKSRRKKAAQGVGVQGGEMGANKNEQQRVAVSTSKPAAGHF